MLCAREVRGAPAISCSKRMAQPTEGFPSAQALCGSLLSPRVHSPWQGFHVHPRDFRIRGYPRAGRLLLPGRQLR
jgi:hypothetical protein